MKRSRCRIPALLSAVFTACLAQAMNSLPVTIDRSMNVVRVWTGEGRVANDFHIEFVARDVSDVRFLDLDDLDPFGYFDGIATNRVVAYDAASKRVSISWSFPDICIPDASAPARFGFTVLGGVRYQAVDWYWTYNGYPVINYQDVWQDWLKVDGQLRDTIVPRPVPVPPPFYPPVPVAFLSRVTGLQAEVATIAEVAATAVPPNTNDPDPGLVAVVPGSPISFAWPWPGLDPTYYMYYELYDAQANPIAGFQNACTLLAQPASNGETPQFAVTDLFPPPTLQYVAAGSSPQSVGGAAWVRDFRCHTFTAAGALPAPNDAVISDHLATLRLDVSFDGGYWIRCDSIGQVRVKLHTAHAGGSGGSSFFDTEMLALDLAGCQQMPALSLRESPTRASLGRTTVSPVSGGYMIDSFFDVFLEVSLDGGFSWTPADGPMRLALQTFAAEAPVPDSRFAPGGSAYGGREPIFAQFGKVAQIRNFTHSQFTHSCALPPAGQQASHAWVGRADFEMSFDGGDTWSPMWSSCRAELALDGMAAGGGASVCGTRFASLVLYGGQLQPEARIRMRGGLPPYSSGCTAVRPDAGGGYQVTSFFDVWLELSLDGGASWQMADNPSGLELVPALRNGRVVECWCDADARRVTVAFSEPMDPVSLADPDNYWFDGQPIERLRLLNDGRTVLATLAGSPVWPCDVTVSGIYFDSGPGIGPLWAPEVTTAIASEGLLETRAGAAARLLAGLPEGWSERVTLTGTELRLVEVAASGQADDSDGDGLDDAVTRVLDSDFVSGDGRYRLRSSDQTLNLGTFEELANVVPGYLDVPPFTAGAGGEMWSRNYRFTFEADGVVMYPESLVDAGGFLSGVEAEPGETLRWMSDGLFVQLLDSGGAPTGYSFGELLLMPNVPGVSLALAGGTGQLTWPKPSPNMRVQVATSLLDQDWMTISSDEYGDGGDFWYYTFTPGEGGAFYRLILQEIE